MCNIAAGGLSKESTHAFALVLTNSKHSSQLRCKWASQTNICQCLFVFTCECVGESKTAITLCMEIGNKTLHHLLLILFYRPPPHPTKLMMKFTASYVKMCVFRACVRAFVCVWICINVCDWRLKNVATALFLHGSSVDSIKLAHTQNHTHTHTFQKPAADEVVV